MDKTPPNIMNQSPPDCPQDGLTMVLRTARKGRYAGSQFWGCSQFPECKEILPFDGNEGGDDHGESNSNSRTYTDKLKEKLTLLERENREKSLEKYRETKKI